MWERHEPRTEPPAQSTDRGIRRWVKLAYISHNIGLAMVLELELKKYTLHLRHKAADSSATQQRGGNSVTLLSCRTATRGLMG